MPQRHNSKRRYGDNIEKDEIKLMDGFAVPDEEADDLLPPQHIEEY